MKNFIRKNNGMQIHDFFLLQSTFEEFQSVFENTTDLDLDFFNENDSILTMAICNPSDVKDSQKKCKYLILKGSDTNVTDIEGNTPLGAAASQGNHELVSLLLQKGANPNFVQRDKHTPLIDAFYHYNKLKHESYLRTIYLLLENGARTSYESERNTISISNFIKLPHHNTLISALLSQPERLPDDFYHILKSFRLQTLL